MKHSSHKTLKLTPIFKNEDQERRFWDTHDSTDYVDWKKAVKNPVFPNLKPSTQKKNRFLESL
jgi:hypothetical protein